MREIQRLAVIGAGTMGRQIALQCARHGFPVALYDLSARVLAEAEDWQRGVVGEWVAAGALSEAAAAYVFENMRYQTKLAEALRDADLAIEAAPERLPLKREDCASNRLLRACLIASNSSSIPRRELEGPPPTARAHGKFHFYLPVWDSRGRSRGGAYVSGGAWGAEAFARRLIFSLGALGKSARCLQGVRAVKRGDARATARGQH